MACPLNWNMVEYDGAGVEPATGLSSVNGVSNWEVEPLKEC